MTDAKPRVGVALEPASPLWGRVPLRTEDGRLLSDFVMFIPRLAQWPRQRRESALAEIQVVFDAFAEHVVFAELNLHINTLWVSVHSAPGVTRDLALAINERVPEAVLVGHQLEWRPRRRLRRWQRLLCSGD